MIQIIEIQLDEIDFILSIFEKQIDKIKLIKNHLILYTNNCLYSIYYFEFEQIIKTYKSKIMGNLQSKSVMSADQIAQLRDICTDSNIIEDGTHYTQSGRIDYIEYSKGGVTVTKKYLYENQENAVNCGIFLAGDYELYKIGE